MAGSKLKKFLFPTEEEYIPEINHNHSGSFAKSSNTEQQTINVKRDMFGQVIKHDYDELESKSRKPIENLRENTVHTKGGTTVVYNPACYEDTREIALELTKRNTVIVNLETVLKDENRRKDATRIIDYLCGVAFALQLEIKKVNATTFLFK